MISLKQKRNTTNKQYLKMASKDEAEWDQAHEVDTDTGRPTKELYTDNDPVTTIKGKINN